MKINKFAFLFMGAVTINGLLANDMEEVISVASYIESSEQNASPVDVISADDFKNSQPITCYVRQ